MMLFNRNHYESTCREFLMSWEAQLSMVPFVYAHTKVITVFVSMHNVRPLYDEQNSHDLNA